MEASWTKKDAMAMCHHHWEKDVSDSVFPKPKKKDQLDNWIAKGVKDWPRSHVKVNDEDN